MCPICGGDHFEPDCPQISGESGGETSWENQGGGDSDTVECSNCGENVSPNDNGTCPECDEFVEG